MSTPFSELTGLGIERGVPLPGEPETPGAVELDAGGRAYFAELEEAHAAKAEAEARIEHAKEMLQKILGETAEATIDGVPVVTWKAHERRAFNQREAKRFLTAEQIAACTQTTVVRTFRRVTGE